jgi:hypothetical protein
LAKGVLNKITQTSKDLADDKDKLAKGGRSDTQKSKLEKEINNLTENLDNLTQSMQDIVDLGKDPSHVYALASQTQSGTNMVTRNKDGTIEIRGSNDAEHIHEITHANVARKFGDLDDQKHWDENGILLHHWPLGIRDEVLAYRRQYAFDNNSFGQKGIPSVQSIFANRRRLYSKT